MKTRSRTCWSSAGVASALLIVAVVALSGCGEKTGTIPISGKVTYQGKPLANARVTFAPKAGGRPADGITNVDGQYKLGTYMAGDGALPGDYSVAISHSDVDVTKPPSTEITDGAVYEPMKEDVAKSKIPAKYQSPAQSGLKAVVEASGPKVFDFALVD